MRIFLRKYEFQLEAAFAVYADFECVLIPIHTAIPDPAKSSTTPLQEHRVCSASYYIACRDDRFYRDPVLIRATTPDDDVVATFRTRLQADVHDLKRIMRVETTMKSLITEQ